MTTTPAPAPAPEVDDVLSAFTLPDWHPEALSAFREVAAQRPDIAGPELVSLENACELISTAATLHAIAREASWRSVGASGQDVIHPFIAEARLSRVQAAAILHKVVAPVTGVALTNSERGRLAAQARWKSHSGRGGRA